MLCSNCGKDVPFVGNVCPWCKKDKSMDQVRHALAIVAGAGCAYIGAKLFGGWGIVGGFFAGGLGAGTKGIAFALDGAWHDMTGATIA